MSETKPIEGIEELIVWLASKWEAVNINDIQK